MELAVFDSLLLSVDLTGEDLVKQNDLRNYFQRLLFRKHS